MLIIYDVRGTVVKRFNGMSGKPGIHSIIWDGINESGNRVSSGIYFYELRAGAFTKTNKMLLVQ